MMMLIIVIIITIIVVVIIIIIIIIIKAIIIVIKIQAQLYACHGRPDILYLILYSQPKMVTIIGNIVNIKYWHY